MQQLMQLLRVVTAGSVDNGKSTLIGRLLYDSKSIFIDTLEDLQRASDLQGAGSLNLALLTDGLKTEREHGITIDVAYRFFTTSRRRFIIIDAPGHVQYTKNMVTGVSQADVALLLVDVTAELNAQTLQHIRIIMLMGIRHLIICINKMDLVAYSEISFEGFKQKIQNEIQNLSSPGKALRPWFFPVSALVGDNIAEPSKNTPWYQGPCLLDFLEQIETEASEAAGPLRFSVQGRVYSAAKEWQYTGKVLGGCLQLNDEVVILPSQTMARIKSISTYNGPLNEALMGQAVTVGLDRELHGPDKLDGLGDIGRGDYIVARSQPSMCAGSIEAKIIWFADENLNIGQQFYLRKNTLECRCEIVQIKNSGRVFLRPNEIAEIQISTDKIITYDSYSENKFMGSAILIHAVTNQTVAALFFF